MLGYQVGPFYAFLPFVNTLEAGYKLIFICLLCLLVQA